jgi:hypothetical protein
MLARYTAVVVFPTPPLRLAMAMTVMTLHSISAVSS